MTDKDTIIAAQEAEILRLNTAIDDLKKWAESRHGFIPNDTYSYGFCFAVELFCNELNKITGDPDV